MDKYQEWLAGYHETRESEYYDIMAPLVNREWREWLVERDSLKERGGYPF